MLLGAKGTTSMRRAPISSLSRARARVRALSLKIPSSAVRMRIDLIFSPFCGLLWVLIFKVLRLCVLSV